MGVLRPPVARLSLNNSRRVLIGDAFCQRVHFLLFRCCVVVLLSNDSVLLKFFADLGHELLANGISELIVQLSHCGIEIHFATHLSNRVSHHANYLDESKDVLLGCNHGLVFLLSHCSCSPCLFGLFGLFNNLVDMYTMLHFLEKSSGLEKKRQKNRQTVERLAMVVRMWL